MGWARRPRWRIFTAEATRGRRKVCAARKRTFQLRSARGEFWFPFGSGACHRSGIPMEFPHFLRIEREGGGGSRHYVVHTDDPKFSMELTPDATAADKVGTDCGLRLAAFFNASAASGSEAEPI